MTGCQLSEATRNAGASVIRAKIPGLNSAISKCRGPNATWPKIRQHQRDYRPTDPHNPAELSGSHKNVDKKIRVSDPSWTLEWTTPELESPHTVCFLFRRAFHSRISTLVTPRYLHVGTAERVLGLAPLSLLYPSLTHASNLR
jgi:hypothetical protein